ncbi:hypothetical protein L3Y34_013409 [Caenorhabditis briggsae]|uniref:Uncharacterized protein n=1 Tax=Caenorhabditis briggsae TaxID=6238 RepID=A0AAE8ZWW7_CAEBR|nr:hypothetical protein L3Y34_013409 [Caenorhabditis briggsae]
MRNLPEKSLLDIQLDSLKMMLNEKENTKFQPMVTEHKKIKMEPMEPKRIKQENVKSIKIEILDYQERAEIVEYGNGEFYDETSVPERFFRELDQDLEFFPGSWH